MSRPNATRHTRTLRAALARYPSRTLGRRLTVHQFLLGLGLALVSQTTEARTDSVETQVARLNRRAMESYDALEFETARKSLIEAIALLKRRGRNETAVAAKTHLNLGIIYIIGFKDQAHGREQFLSALRADPNAQLDPALASPEIEPIFADAKRQLAAERPAPAAAPAAEVALDEGDSSIRHVPLEETRPKQPLGIRARYAGNPTTELWLFYRSGVHEDYTSVRMTRNANGDYTATIPAADVIGRAVQYYLEARDTRGTRKSALASSVNPYIVILSGSEPSRTFDDRDEPPPSAAQQAAKTSRPVRKQRFFINLYPGFGFGYQPSGNRFEVAHQLQPSAADPAQNQYSRLILGQGGAAIAPFHLAVEAGIFVVKGLSISLLGRFQIVTAANAETQNPDGLATRPTRKASGAIAGFLRARYHFLSGRVHPYVHGTFGIGQIRHMLDVSGAQTATTPLTDSFSAGRYNSGDTTSPVQQVCPSANDCRDSIALGLVFLGGGGGVWFDVHRYVALLIDTTLLGAIGSGAGQSGMNIDLQIGLGTKF